MVRLFRPFLALALATPALASQSQVHVAQGADLLGGDLDGVSVDGDGVVVAGPDQKVMVESLPGAVLALARGGDGQLYAATGNPGRVVRVDVSSAVEVYAADRALVTALLPVGKNLVALTAPDGGAVLLTGAKEKPTPIAAPAKLLLGGAVVDDVVYAVGSNDDGGVVLSLAPGAKAFEVVATTKEPLRSIAARKVDGKLRLICGASDEGVVYAVDATAAAGQRVRALLDAVPGEVTAVAIDADGTVFAALTDGEGKLSKLATTKAKESGGDDDDDDKKSKKPMARKVKGGEVWRLGTDGSARVLFSSKTHGPYALVVDGARVLIGTGPEGRVYAVDSRGAGHPGVFARRAGNDEVTALLLEKSGVVAGMSHQGALVFFGKGQTSTAHYLSPVFDADARARYGLARVALKKGSARVALRTGFTKEPDETWSAWTSATAASTAGTSLTAPPAPYAQLKVDVSAGAAFDGVSLAYLVDNRAPEIAKIDVLAAGWKVVANPRDPPETRSVTFNAEPFAKFLDRRGSMNPTLDERPYGKQSFDVGYRTVYAYAEDADKDALRYRFSLGVAGSDGAVTTWTPLQDWSEAPFVSFEASRLKDALYRVKVEVDDGLTNGAVRALRDELVSAPFEVTHKVPAVTSTSAVRTKDSRGGDAVRVQLSVAAATPLISVRCATGLSDWLPLDPKDGVLDGASESFDVVLPAAAGSAGASCEVYDEALNFARVDISAK